MGGFTWVQEQGAAESRMRRLRETVEFQWLRLQEAWDERDADEGWFAQAATLARAASGLVALVVAAVLAAVLLWTGARAVGLTGPNTTRTAPATVAGTAGGDTIAGTARADHVRAAGGDDLVLGYAGADRLDGQGGNDVLVGGAGNDSLYADVGEDVLLGGSGDDKLYATALDGIDRLVCGPGNDTAYVASVNGRVRDRTIGCEKVVVTEYRVRPAHR